MNLSTSFPCLSPSTCVHVCVCGGEGPGRRGVCWGHHTARTIQLEWCEASCWGEGGVCMCVRLYASACMCVWVCAWECMHAYVCVCVCVCVCMRVYAYVCVSMHTVCGCIYIVSVCMCVRANWCVRVCAHVWVHVLHVCSLVKVYNCNTNVSTGILYTTFSIFSIKDSPPSILQLPLIIVSHVDPPPPPILPPIPTQAKKRKQKHEANIGPVGCGWG